ncbi:MAG: dihydrofolate reductase [Flavipsychrobacter sp.]|jgi:dihydrofolate reductase|nr:dihydrofolate reductase [Flavipsychrobacter sp.]
MNKLSVFIFATLNGFYKGTSEDISWHKHGDEEHQFAIDSVKTGNMLLFGRITYQMMAGYWPTPQALKNDPQMTMAMNAAEKVVFSRTLEKAEWNNTRLVKDNMFEEIKRLKKTGGKNMTLLGSGNVLTQLAEQKLIDEYQILIDPVAIDDGTPMFKYISHTLELKLTSTRSFNSGIVLLNYKPA